MAERKLSSRERIVASALALFSQQGITATTTKEIAEQAGVNEVTLFRQFGSKQGLLLAVIQEAPIIEKMQVALADIVGANDPLMAYGSSGLELLSNVPELMRSLIGEAGQLPLENQQALHQALRQANQQTVGYLRAAQLTLSGLSIEDAASLLNTLLLGYAVINFSPNTPRLWPSQEDFLASVDALFLASSQPTSAPLAPDTPAIDKGNESPPEREAITPAVEDLPEDVVRSLFQKAKKHSTQAYALVYVLFGAGLRLDEALGLLRSQSFSNKTQHLLTITAEAPGSPASRQVPLNRWIMGNRYGTYTKNPLTQWLKSRQDDCPKIFVSDTGEPLTLAALTQLWETIAADILTATGTPPTPFQARQTWCIELLMKGISLENLSILSGLSLTALEQYANRAKAKTALEQALSIDQKTA